MSTIRCVAVFSFLLISTCVYGQSNLVERRVADFDSNGVGLTETLLAFAHQEHLPIAIEYIDRESMGQAVGVKVQNKTVGQALNAILLHGDGYRWKLRNGIIAITNWRGSKHAESVLNTVIPVSMIPEGPGATVKMMSLMLWWNLQMELDPKLKKGGIAGHISGNSPTVKPEILQNLTVREILDYIVVHSQAEAWVVAGPPKCLGYTPYCGLWYFVEGDAFNTSYQFVLGQVRQNL